MKNKRKSNPFVHTAAILVVLFVVLIVSAIGMFYYVFAIPEPEGLSLASWPDTFTDNFSAWIEEKDCLLYTSYKSTCLQIGMSLFPGKR